MIFEDSEEPETGFHYNSDFTFTDQYGDDLIVETVAGNVYININDDTVGIELTQADLRELIENLAALLND